MPLRAFLSSVSVPENSSPDRTTARVQAMFAKISGRYDLANHLLSGGLDFLWRRRAADLVQSWAPQTILDLATGSGDLALALRRRCPKALLVGADFTEPMLTLARRKGVSSLVAGDGLALPFLPASFDAVTVAFGLRNMESWSRALAEMARVLRPGGHLLVLDFALPSGLFGLLYRSYLNGLLPRFAGVVTGESAAYEYLGDSIAAFPSGEAMCRLLCDAGFSAPREERLAGGAVALYTASR